MDSTFKIERTSPYFLSGSSKVKITLASVPEMIAPMSSAGIQLMPKISFAATPSTTVFRKTRRKASVTETSENFFSSSKLRLKAPVKTMRINASVRRKSGTTDMAETSTIMKSMYWETAGFRQIVGPVTSPTSRSRNVSGTLTFFIIFATSTPNPSRKEK
ncbi:hypothetical protein BMS3Abin16_00010 [archaeon BMS3Abin16]|nr:hypothetical protein BMS3Abin16_00010 [archaeon BMS3Abin16]GBE55974.1 hypothetical protein BMS3Bbin16_00171 [archaeon BMS3Bbin16]